MFHKAADTINDAIERYEAVFKYAGKTNEQQQGWYYI